MPSEEKNNPENEMKDEGAAAHKPVDSGRAQQTRDGSGESNSSDGETPHGVSRHLRKGRAKAQSDDAYGDGHEEGGGGESGEKPGGAKREGEEEKEADRLGGSVSIEWEVAPEAVEAMGTQYEADGAAAGEAADAEERFGFGWHEEGGVHEGEDDGPGGDSKKEASKKSKISGDAWERFGGWRSSRREKKSSEKKSSEQKSSEQKSSEQKSSEQKSSEQKSSEKKPAGHHDGAFARGRGFVEGMVPDSVKKLFVAGLGALFTGEEGARRVAADLSLPKDAASFLLTQVQTTKRELFRIVAGEIRDFLENVNLGAELQRILTSLTFEVKMQIRLKPSENDNGVRPQVKGKVRVVPKKEQSKDREKRGDKTSSRDES